MLDFGLAKAAEPGTVSADATQSPTITSPAMTQMGVILGTSGASHNVCAGPPVAANSG